jgi:hypothetical protein
MSSKHLSKLTVAFTVAFLVTGSFLALVGERVDEDGWPVGPVGGTLNDYTAKNSGLPSSGDYFYLKLVDVNGDGYDDIVAGAGQYPSSRVNTYGVKVYTWKSGGGWEANATDLPTTGNFAGLDVGDVDGDGDMDIVVGGESWSGSSIKGCRVYVNNGTTGGKIDWDEVTGPDTNMYYDQCVLADIDDDDDLDIVAGTRSNGIRCWTGNGGSGGTFSWTAANTNLPTSGEYTGVAVADMNKDGDLDIVATDYSGSSPAVRLYTGNGAGTWTSRASSMPTDSAQSFGIAVGDVDKDGDMDIVYGRTGGLRCYLGNSGGTGGTSFTWTAASTNLATSSRHNQLTLADLDKDGDLDIVTAVAGGGVVAYLGNGGAGSGQSWTKASKGLPSSGQYHGADVGDFDNDGVPDIVGAMWQDSGSSGGIYAWQGSVQEDYDPTAEAVWKDTTVNETTSMLGDPMEVDGTGSSDPQDAPTGDADGDKLTYDWNFTVVPAGSAVTDASLSPSDSNATPSFTSDAAGVYRLSLTVKDSAGNWSGEVYLKLDVSKPNDAPVADAGTDQTVTVGDRVELNSSGSSDSDGAISNWQWNASAGNPSTVTLNDATLPVAWFTAPSVVGTYEFILTVRDDNLTWSEPDYVNVTVELPPNQPPVAVAPNDFATRVDETVSLNASGSYDQDGGSIVAWDWNCTSHPSLTITDDKAEAASFTPVLPGDYVFTLVVQDDRGDWSAPDSVTVTVQPADVNVPPVAEISGPAVVNKYVGDDVVLDGSSSRDDDGTIEEYVWNCTSHPTLEFTGQNTTTVSFRPAEPGDFVFTLAVLDDNGSWCVNEDTVTVRVTQPPVNTPPEPVIAGPSEKVRPGDQVTLDGSQSADRDGSIVEFKWRCISHPTLNFTGQNTTYIRFTPETIGDYTFTLDVLDNLGAWADDPAYWTVSVKTNVAPVANITGPTMGLPGVNISFSASASVDGDGDVVAWSWDCTSHDDLYMNGTENETMHVMASYADIYVIVLTVQDDEGAWSQVAEHSLNITPIDGPPTADAGRDKEVRMNVVVELNGGGSSDVEGDIVSWRWVCTSHTNVPGLVNSDQMVASFTPPEPGTFIFSLEVQDEAGQWSQPDSVEVLVLEENSRPTLTITSPKAGDEIELSDLNPSLVIEWDAYDANGDTLRYSVRVRKVDGKLSVAYKGDIAPIHINWTFNDTSFNFPRDTELEVVVEAWETNTADRYETTATAGPFMIKDPTSSTNGGGGEEDPDGIDLNYIILAVVVLVGITFAAFALSRGGDGEEEVPWEDEEPRAPARTTGAKSALAPKGTVDQTAKAQAKVAAAAKAQAEAKGKSTDPHGRMLDCPDCGAPLDHDTDFGAPYCWDCDKYF